MERKDQFRLYLQWKSFWQLPMEAAIARFLRLLVFVFAFANTQRHEDKDNVKVFARFTTTDCLVAFLLFLSGKQLRGVALQVQNCAQL